MILPDFKDQQGLWVFNKGSDYTVSGSVYREIKARCKVGGTQQLRSPTYIGCENHFKDFQHFVNWAKRQVGYDRGFHLDKDILIKGNKVYSQNTCVFVPHDVNVLLAKANRIRGRYPIGVSYYKRDGVFTSQCCNGEGKKVHLGRFSCPTEAFAIYKEYKELLIKLVADKYKCEISSQCYEALMKYNVEISD